MDSAKDIRVLSICAGYGGIEIALERSLGANLKIVTVEIETFAVANLVSKAEQNKMAVIANYTDVKSFPSEKFRGCFDIITAGFPCQPFSTAGKRLGGYDPRHLWPYIAEHIRTIKPVYVYLENVPGLLSARTLDNRPDLQRYLARLGKAESRLNAKDKWRLSRHRERLAAHFLRQEGIQAYGAIYYGLRDMGYKVEAGLFTAAEVGAPHKRERLFILAHAKSTESGHNSKANRSKAKDLRRESQGDVLKGHDKFNRELENPERLGRRGRDNGEYRGQGRTLQAEGSGQLADGNGSGCKEQRRTESIRQEHETAECCGNGGGRWPARPGQEQYPWEEPRTVKSGMGRTANGHPCRVDRLRLCGNGVSPKQAELAYITLWEKILS